MTQLQNVFTLDVSLQVAGILFLFWIGQKAVDAFLQFAINEKIFSPIYRKILRRLKIIKTRGRPIVATFELSFTPEEEITITSAIDRLKAGFQIAERASGGRISLESSHWNETEWSGRVEIYYSDQTEQFTIDVDIVPDTESIRDNPEQDPTDVVVGSIGLEVDFGFPFYLLEDTLFNLGSLINYLEDGFNDQLRGNFSNGRFVISPVESDLTMDEWIEQEQFDISLLLASEDDDGSKVEFFSDRAVVKSTRREIDAQTVRYVRELLLNYYL